MKNTRKIVWISILTALAILFYFVEISVGFLFPSAPFLKIDFSDLPALIGGIVTGPSGAILIQLFKNVLHALLMTKEPSFSGEIGNFAAGVFFVLPILFSLQFKRKISLLLGCIAGTLAMTLMMCFVNYVVTLPLYGIPEAARIPLILSTFIPFNIIKGILLSAVFMVLYPHLDRFLCEHQAK
ncbi:MAG: ECF transporter S component [Erysipelotrichaceae bacterium]|nr:ECF transporter S component [Erysipelotrichaceae bacterium]